MRAKKQNRMRRKFAAWMAAWLTIWMAAAAMAPTWTEPAAAASLLTSPQGGETWEIGSRQNITWDPQNYQAGDSYVELAYSTNSGSDWNQIAQNVPVVPAQFTWTVPDKPTGRARIKITVWKQVIAEDLTTSQVIADTGESVDFTISQASPPSSPAPGSAPVPTPTQVPSPPASPAAGDQTANITILVNGQPLASNAPPYLVNDRVMVPFRAIFEALGATVDWNAENRSVTGTRDKSTVRLVVDSKTAYVNDEPVVLDAVPQIVSDRTFVPLRFVGEALGAGVDWDDSTRTVSVTLSASGETPTVTATPSPQTGPKRISIQDSAKRVVTVPVNPKRIVVTNSDAADVICALGAADNIIGAPSDLLSMPLLNQKIANAQNVGTISNPNPDLITSLKPDIMFGLTDQAQELTSKLSSKGIPVVLLDCSGIDTMDSDLKTMGAILGQQQRAANLMAFIDKYRQLVADRLKGISGSKKPRLYWEAAADYTVAGADTPDGSLLPLLGVNNVAAKLQAPSTVVTPAWVIAANPNVIIKAVDYTTVSSGYLATSDAMQQQQDLIVNRPGWSHISAVINDNVYILSRTVIEGPQYVIGVLYAVKWLHPALFTDVDLLEIQKEMLSQFYELDFNGAWVYPPPA